MCWLSLMLRLLFQKSQRRLDSGHNHHDDVDDVYMLSTSSEETSTGSEVDATSFPQFARLPDDCLGHVFTLLDWRDAQRLRVCSRQMNGIFEAYRSKIPGPEMAAYVGVDKKGLLSIHCRMSDRVYTKPVEIPRLLWPSIFRNAVIDLVLRLGESQLTADHCREVLEVVQKTSVEAVQVRVATLSRELLELVNKIGGSPKVGLIIGRFCALIEHIVNLDNLKVHSELTIAELTTILAWNEPWLENLCVKVPSASIRLIYACIDEWRHESRRISSWYFRLPHAELAEFEHVPTRWHDTLTRDVPGRLVMQSVTQPIDPDDTIRYQAVSWLAIQ